MPTEKKIETAVISQPHCYPWMGYMKLLRSSDVFVVLDNVQFEKRSWQSRNRIKTPAGPAYLTVPVISKGKFDQPISEVRIDNTRNWRRKHSSALEMNYRRAPFFEEVMQALGPALDRECDLLMDFTLGVIGAFCSILGFEPNLRFASGIGAAGDKNEYLINICRHFGATRYISNDGSAAYLREDMFTAAGVELSFLRYSHPVYPQLFGAFEPYMSTFDVLFNAGPEAAAELVMAG